MRTQRSTSKSQSNHNLAARVGRWSVQHRRKAILGWLAFVFVALVVGFNMVPQKNLEPGEGMPGESGKASQVLKDGFPKQQEQSGEQVLIQSKSLKASDAEFKSAVADVTKRLEGTKGVTEVVGPYKAGSEGISKDGHSALVTFTLPGKSDVTEKSVVQLAGGRSRRAEGASRAPHRRDGRRQHHQGHADKATRRWAGPCSCHLDSH